MKTQILHLYHLSHFSIIFDKNVNHQTGLYQHTHDLNSYIKAHTYMGYV